MILTDGATISPRHLTRPLLSPVDEPAVDPWAGVDLSGGLNDAVRRVAAEIEQRKIRAALADAGGNKWRAAELLLVSYKTLLAKLKEHKIE